MLCISDLTIFFPVIVVHPSLLSHSISLYDYITLSLYILLWMRSAVIVVLCHFIFKFLKLNIFERQRVGDWSKEMGIESEREKEREVGQGRERNSHPPVYFSRAFKDWHWAKAKAGMWQFRFSCRWHEPSYSFLPSRVYISRKLEVRSQSRIWTQKFQCEMLSSCWAKFLSSYLWFLIATLFVGFFADFVCIMTLSILGSVIELWYF